LRKKSWPKDIKERLSAISEHLLHSDFDEIAEAADKLIEG